jgi:hypothetical protein
LNQGREKDEKEQNAVRDSPVKKVQTLLELESE